MAEVVSNNCHFCSDEVQEGTPTVRKVDVWRDDEGAIMPAFIATGEVAHRGCAQERALNEDQIERFKARLREDLAQGRRVVVLGDDDLPSVHIPGADIPGQEKLFDGQP